MLGLNIEDISMNIGGVFNSSLEKFQGSCIKLRCIDPIIETIKNIFRKIKAFFSFLFSRCSKQEENKDIKVDKKPLMSFYTYGKNDQGRALDEILSMSFDDLEKVHNYIQRLFPLDEKSRFDPSAPLSTKTLQNGFKTSSDMRGEMLRAFEVMLSFYGLRRESGIVKIDNDTFDQRKKVWLKGSDNHNFSRISRIIKSLIMHGLEKEGRVFQKFICDFAKNHKDGQHISPKTLKVWSGI